MYIHIHVCNIPLTLAASAMASSFLIATITSWDDPPVMIYICIYICMYVDPFIYIHTHIHHTFDVGGVRDGL